LKFDPAAASLLEPAEKIWLWNHFPFFGKSINFGLTSFPYLETLKERLAVVAMVRYHLSNEIALHDSFHS